MTLQKEPGRSHEPMRPRLITLDMASDFTAPLDSGGSVNWAAGGPPDGFGKMTLRQLNRYFDVGPQLLSISGGNVVVPRGLWRIQMVIESNKSTTSGGAIGLAITNEDGSVVHKEWDQLQYPAEDGRMTSTFEHFLKVTTPTATVAFRAARRSAGSTITVDAAYVGTIQKIANHSEALEV